MIRPAPPGHWVIAEMERQHLHYHTPRSAVLARWRAGSLRRRRLLVGPERDGTLARWLRLDRGGA